MQKWPFYYEVSGGTFTVTCCLPYLPGVGETNVSFVWTHHRGNTTRTLVHGQDYVKTYDGLDCSRKVHGPHGWEMSLVVDKLQQEDEGTYRCTYHTPNGAFTNFTQLGLTCKY